MCLSNKTGRPKRSTGVGYKVFNVDNYGVLSFEYDCDRGGYEYSIPVGVWIDEKDFRGEEPEVPEITGYDGVNYPKGFHIYKKKSEIQDMSRIYRVQYRGAHTEGIQTTQYRQKLHIIVARKIKILKKARR